MSWTFYPRCDVVVVGRDEETGDKIHGRAWYIVAENDLGERYAHDFSDAHRSHREDVVPEPIMTLLGRIERAQINPVGRQHWHATHPCYGSPAYMAQQTEIVAEERAADQACWN